MANFSIPAMSFLADKLTWSISNPCYPFSTQVFFAPHHAPHGTSSDLQRWTTWLSWDNVSRPIPSPRTLQDINAFSDTSSLVGIGIVIDGRWRAWRLILGWKQDGRDIGWAEAVGFELQAWIIAWGQHIEEDNVIMYVEQDAWSTN